MSSKNGSQPPDAPSTSTSPSTTTLEAIYVINRQAKEYKDTASRKSDAGYKTTAKAYRYRKRALYKVKKEALIELLPKADRIDRHTINGIEHYCPHFDHFCFHLSANSVDIDPERVTERKPLNKFTEDTKTQNSDLSLKTALKHLDSVLELNANTHLPDTHLWDDNTRRFIGWTYLDSP